MVLAWFNYVTLTTAWFNYITLTSVSGQLIGSKSNPTFSPVKIPYTAHSSLNTAST